MFARFRRRRRDPERVDPDDVMDELRLAITRLDDQRRLVADLAGRTLVTRAEVARACTEQLQALSRATGGAEAAEATAVRAADGARADGDASAVDYDRTAEALHASQQVLAAAAEPVHALLADARRNADQAGEVLAAARTTLDAQLREQVRLLREFERWETRRQVEAVRRRGSG